VVSALSFTKLQEAWVFSKQPDFNMADIQYETDLDLVPEDSPKSYKAGTIRDQQDMRRVGKTQELRVSGELLCVDSCTD
jgi:hypothetical protein